jgi:hypothetical protein
MIQRPCGERRRALLVVKRFRPPPLSAPRCVASELEGRAGSPLCAATEADVKASEAHNSQTSNPSIERAGQSLLRSLWPAAHVER